MQGFIYDNEEIIAYTNRFIFLKQKKLITKFGLYCQILTKNKQVIV
jgi:hypothetical protein